LRKKASRDEQNDILLQVSDNISLNISLQIGDVATGVTVNSTDQGIRTADADLGSVIEARQLEDLPVKDNNPLLMATLSAGVLDFASSSSGGQTQAFTSSTPSNISISGVASSGANGGNTYTLDGAPNNAGNRNGVGYNQAFTPTTAMVSEFKIQTATYDAGSGYGPGANVNLSLKSGTDHFHGQLYETMQNPALNANSYFTNLAGLPKDNNRQHDWSAVISGPVILPKIYNGRSRTFFMYGYNGISNSFPKSTNAVYSVPTDAERRGDFSALLASGIKIYNPYSTVKDPANAGHFIRTPFANNVIPFGSSLNGHQFNMDSYANYILNTHMPRPNVAGVADGENNLVLQQYQTNWYQSHVARIDHTINDRHSLFGHFYYSHLDEYDQIRFNRGAGWTYFRDNRGFDVDDVYTFTPRLVLNTRASVTRYSTATVPVTEGEDLTATGLSQNYISQINSIDPGHTRLPDTAIEDMPEFSGNARDSYPSTIWSIASNVTWLLGSHSLKLGSEYRLYRDNGFSAGSDSGELDYNSDWTRLSDTTPSSYGQGFAGFVMGLPTGGSIQVSDSYAEQYQIVSGYVQDNWKATSRLAVNFGLRYEYEFPATESQNRSITQFNMTTVNPLQAAASAAYSNSGSTLLPARLAVLGGLLFAGVDTQSSLWKAKNGPSGLQPRFGITYTIDNNTVVRAGYGIFNQITRFNPIQTGFSQTTGSDGSESRRQIEEC
jgi:hypothetical protein